MVARRYSRYYPDPEEFEPTDEERELARTAQGAQQTGAGIGSAIGTGLGALTGGALGLVPAGVPVVGPALAAVGAPTLASIGAGVGGAVGNAAGSWIGGMVGEDAEDELSEFEKERQRKLAEIEDRRAALAALLKM